MSAEQPFFDVPDWPTCTRSAFIDRLKFRCRPPKEMRHSVRNPSRTPPVPLEPLKEGHRIDPQERVFLEAAERGDKHTVMRCLQGQKPVNVNCTNILGRSAIQVGGRLMNIRQRLRNIYYGWVVENSGRFDFLCGDANLVCADCNRFSLCKMKIHLV